MENINILIADNQSFTRIGITTILSGYLNHHLFVEHVRTKDELYEKLCLNQSHILIIDYHLFDFNGINELSQIRKISKNIGILIITDNNTADDVFKVLDCGITNYILKSCAEQELIEAFNATLSSRKYFCSEVLNVLLEKKNMLRTIPVKNGKLTPSEIEIVRLITQGLTTKGIAIQKKLSYHTIITHRKNIFRKLAICNTSELIMFAMRTGLVDTTEYYI